MIEKTRINSTNALERWSQQEEIEDENVYGAFWLNPDSLEALTKLPRVQAVELSVMRDVKTQSAETAKRLISYGWKLLSANVAVSLLHSWQIVSQVVPSGVEPLALPGWTYHAASFATICIVDLTVLFLTSALMTLRIARMQPPKRAIVFTLFVIFLLNVSFFSMYGGAWIGLLLSPILKELYVLLIPGVIVMIYWSVKSTIAKLQTAILRSKREIEILNASIDEMKRRESRI